MPKLAKIRRRRRKATSNPTPKRNPPLGTDVVEYILPGFAAFGATRVLTRIATVQIAKRKPSLAKHAGALAAVGSFAAAWFGAHRVQQLEKYHHPIVVGSGLAAIQSLIQLYFPGIGKALDMAQLEAPAATKDVSSQVTAAARQVQQSEQAASALPPVPDGFTQTDANAWYSYNDSYDAGSYKNKPRETPAPESQMTAAVPDDQQLDDLLDNSDMGLFS